MTSLQATLRDALAPPAMPGRASSAASGYWEREAARIEAAVVAWLADPATTTRAAQALYEADAGRIRRPWEHLTPAERAIWCERARAALGAITRDEAGA